MRCYRITIGIAWVLLAFLQPSSAMTNGDPLNPVTDIAYEGIFPIKIAGISTGGFLSKSSELTDPPDIANAPLCVCPFELPPFFRIGIPISFYEPARLIELVRDPFYFPTLGMSIPATAVLSGSISGNNTSGGPTSAKTFAQAHYLVFPVWAIMELLTDFICVEHSGFDVGWMTEFDPLWNDDQLLTFFEPESLLFANPIAQFSCITDAVQANLTYPNSALPWCAGAHGSVYPLAGLVESDQYVESQGLLAARVIYKLCRQGMIQDTAVDLCSAIPTPIWVKHNYRLQLAKPVRGSPQPIGRTGLLWTVSKDPPYIGGADNFLFVVFRKRACCAM